MKKTLFIITLLSVVLTVSASSNGGVRHLQPKRVPVILANYTDVQFKNTDFSVYKASLEKYFADNSFGQYTPSFDIIGPVTLPGDRRSYGANDEEGDDIGDAVMIADACNSVEDLADFTLYDQDGDGRIDALAVIYAGEGEKQDYLPDAVWEFTDDLETTLELDYLVQLDGKTVASCCAVPELRMPSKRDGIGTFIHEFAHILGLPNFSSTAGLLVKTLGDWDVMDHGCFNDGANTPSAMSAYERWYLGWIEPILLDGPMNVRLRDLNESGDCAIITATGQSNLNGLSPDPREFYILENRQQSGWDQYIPGHGLMLTKIDYVKNKWESDEVNSVERHLCVDLVEADGKAPQYKADNLTNGYFGKQGDLFPSGASEYKMFSNKQWFNNVKEQGGVIYLDFQDGVDKCTVHFSVTNGTPSQTSATETKRYGGVKLPSVTPNSGYSFKGWTTRKNSKVPDAGQPGDTFYPMNDCSVFAIMQDNTRYWYDHNLKGVTHDKYIGFNGYVKVNDIHDIGMTYIKKEGYQTPTANNCVVRVECGGKLVPDAYTFDADTIRVAIPAAALTGDIYVNIVNVREQNEDGCAPYSHTFTEQCRVEEKADLSGYDWRVTIANDNTIDYDKTKGAVFGSGQYPAGLVKLYTEETLGCAVAQVNVKAAANGDGVLSVYVAGNQIGEQELDETITEYSFDVEEPVTGAVEIRLTNTTKAMFLKQIDINFVKLEDPEVTEGIEEILSNQPATNGRKLLHDGQLFILFNGHIYNALGAKLK